jgi:3-oxoacyl-[acyl-carrier-protein] synthase-3
MSGGRITGVGSALPDNVVTNHDLAKTLDTSHEWILERTGISERRIGGTTGGLGLEAANIAIERSGIDPAEVQLVLFSTITSDQLFPATANMIQDAIGAEKAGAVDLNAACSGFVYALISGFGHIALGADKVLIVGAETLSRVIDWEDRNTAILFGDGGGAAVLEATDGPSSLLGWDLGSKGSVGHILQCDDMQSTVTMDGKEVFRQAIVAMSASATSALDMAGLTIDDVDIIIPHQANIHIIEAAFRRLGAPMEKAVTNLDRTGNTSSASIPLAMDEALEQGRINEGDIVLLTGFGAGMSSASAVLRWG